MRLYLLLLGALIFIVGGVLVLNVKADEPKRVIPVVRDGYKTEKKKLKKVAKKPKASPSPAKK